MAVLYLYADESGTMPQRDTDAPFVTATVSFFGDQPDLMHVTRHRSEIISRLFSLNAIPFVAFVKPFPGYEDSINLKLSKINIMARVTRLLTRANTQYLDEHGIGLRNYIWIYAMQQAIGNTVGVAMRKDSIDALQILMDQKTLPVPTRTLFTEQVLAKSEQVRDVLARLKTLSPNRISLYENNIRFTRNSTSLHWSDEMEVLDKDSRLKLSDKLARIAYRNIRDGHLDELTESLAKAGFPDSVMNLTEIIMSPLKSRLVAAWERTTGLKEPRDF